MTQHLGPGDYGLFVTALTFVTLAIFLTDLGVGSVAGRELQNVRTEPPKFWAVNLGLRLTLSLVLVPLLIIVAFLIYPDHSPQLYWAIALIAFAVPFQSIRSVAAGFFVAGIRNYFTAGIAILNQIVYVVGIVVSLYLRYGIVGCACAYLLSTIASSVAALFLTRREVDFRPRFDMRKWKEVVGQSLSIGLIQIVNLIYLKADTFLLSVMATPQAVGLYGVAYVIISFLTLGPGLLMVSPAIDSEGREGGPRLSPKTRSGVPGSSRSPRRLRSIYICASSSCPIGRTEFPCCCSPCTNLGLSCIFTYVNNAFGFAAFARDGHHRMLLVSVIGLAVNVVSNVLAIPRFGSTVQHGQHLALNSSHSLVSISYSAWTSGFALPSSLRL